MPRSRPGRLAATAVTVLAGAVLGSLLLIAPASAHALLESSDPSDGAALDEAPSQVELVFNEPVDAASDGLRVFDGEAVRVDTGPLERDHRETVAVGLPADLPDGGYVVTFRVSSDDDHPIAGVLTFTVGGAAGVDDALVAELFGGAGTSFAGVAGPLLRGLGYAASLLAAGVVGTAGLVARREEHRRLARGIGTRAAASGIGLALVAVPVQGAAVAGVSVVEAATSARVLGDVVSSGFGQGTLVRGLALAVILTLWRRPSPAAPAALGAVAALGSYLLDGHQRSVEPAWAMIPGDAVHLIAGAMWLAGLLLLAVLLHASSGEDSAVPLARYLARFSTMALITVGLLAASGLTMAWPLVGRFGALTSTTYGWLLLGKLTAVAVVVLLALYNRQRLVPVMVAAAAPRGGSGDETGLATEERATGPRRTGPRRTGPRASGAWGVLTRTVRLEAIVLVGVLLVTGFLVSQRPAAEEAGLRGLYEVTAPLGDDLEVDVVVDPNRVGRNAIHLYVIDATGRPVDDVEEVVLELTYLDEGIGPIVLEPLVAGPGHWVANSDDLRFAGEWELRVVAGVDRFTELTTQVTIPVSG